MNPRARSLAICLVVAALALSACRAATVSPETVAREYVTSLSHGDAAEVVRLLGVRGTPDLAELRSEAFNTRSPGPVAVRSAEPTSARLGVLSMGGGTEAEPRVVEVKARAFSGKKREYTLLVVLERSRAGEWFVAEVWHAE